MAKKNKSTQKKYVIEVSDGMYYANRDRDPFTRDIYEASSFYWTQLANARAKFLMKEYPNIVSKDWKIMEVKV